MSDEINARRERHPNGPAARRPAQAIDHRRSPVEVDVDTRYTSIRAYEGIDPGRAARLTTHQPPTRACTERSTSSIYTEPRHDTTSSCTSTSRSRK